MMTAPSEKPVNKAHLLVNIEEEMSKLLTRYTPQIKVRERPAQHQLCPTSEVDSSAMTVPAPTRFTRKQRALDRNQTRNSCPQIPRIDKKEGPLKYDAPYDSVLFQLMESETLNMNDVKAYISSRDSRNSTRSSYDDDDARHSSASDGWLL
jgi:uncharacterized FlgJ-related protein